MNTTRYEQLSDAEKREIRMYGCTVDEMAAAITESLAFRFSGPGLYAMRILSDAQEMIANDTDGTYSFMQVEDARQAINRAKWVISQYFIPQVNRGE